MFFMYSFAFFSEFWLYKIRGNWPYFCNKSQRPRRYTNIWWVEEESYGSRKRKKYGSTVIPVFFWRGKDWFKYAFLSTVSKLKLLKAFLSWNLTRYCWFHIYNIPVYSYIVLILIKTYSCKLLNEGKRR